MPAAEIYDPIAVGLDGSARAVALSAGRESAFFRPVDAGVVERLDIDAAAAVHALQVHAVELERMQAHLSQLVAEAREAGASWALIGFSLGITREGARKRWAPLIPQQRGHSLD